MFDIDVSQKRSASPCSLLTQACLDSLRIQIDGVNTFSIEVSSSSSSVLCPTLHYSADLTISFAVVSDMLVSTEVRNPRSQIPKSKSANSSFLTKALPDHLGLSILLLLDYRSLSHQKKRNEKSKERCRTKDRKRLHHLKNRSKLYHSNRWRLISGSIPLLYLRILPSRPLPISTVHEPFLRNTFRPLFASLPNYPVPAFEVISSFHSRLIRTTMNRRNSKETRNKLRGTFWRNPSRSVKERGERRIGWIRPRRNVKLCRISQSVSEFTLECRSLLDSVSPLVNLVVRVCRLLYWKASLSRIYKRGYN